MLIAQCVRFWYRLATFCEVQHTDLLAFDEFKRAGSQELCAPLKLSRLLGSQLILHQRSSGPRDRLSEAPPPAIQVPACQWRHLGSSPVRGGEALSGLRLTGLGETKERDD